MGRKNDPLRIVEEINILPCKKSYIFKPDSLLENEIHKMPWNFGDANGLPNPGQSTSTSDN